MHGRDGNWLVWFLVGLSQFLGISICRSIRFRFGCSIQYNRGYWYIRCLRSDRLFIIHEIGRRNYSGLVTGKGCGRNSLPFVGVCLPNYFNMGLKALSSSYMPPEKSVKWDDNWKDSWRNSGVQLDLEKCKEVHFQMEKIIWVYKNGKIAAKGVQKIKKTMSRIIWYSGRI